MKPLDRTQLYSLEQYAAARQQFRSRVMAHKKTRVVALGANATMHFEDALTMQYQVQEMLRLERIFEPELIQQELDVYNPLIPDGRNWKATFMLEFSDVAERKRRLAELHGVEKAIWIQVADFARITPVANEDLERSTPDKTSSVHFLRFETSDEVAAAVKAGAAIRIGIDHPAMQVDIALPTSCRDSLAADLA